MTEGVPNSSVEAILLAGRARSREEFFFAMVNRSVLAARYDRASVWSLARRPAALAVSGMETAARDSAFAASWSKALATLPDRAAPARFTGDAEPWQAIAAATGGLDALWLPMPRHGAAVLFERWGDAPFSPEEHGALADLVAAYELVAGRPRRGYARMAGRGLVWLAALAAVAAALVLVRLPLRVVAGCEVVARSPRLVSAPMEGVIEEVLVSPGQRVVAGDRLAVYDSRLMEEELKISRRQVEVVEAELASARARAFSEPRARGDAALLEARLEQEQARLEALEVRFARREVTAPVDGMVQLDDARAWRGKPVGTGQAILWLVNPEETRVALRLPQDDRVDFDLSRPIRVHLYAMGGEAREARLTYISSFAQPTPDGVYAFPAEAEWLSGGAAPPLGLRGSAMLYGEEASLGYWLFRRPLAWLRRRLGV